MTLGEKVRERRLSAHLTQAELAGTLLTRNMISEIESGKALPSLRTIEYLAKRFGISARYFLEADRTLAEELTDLGYPKIKRLFAAGQYAKVIETAEQTMPDGDDPMLAFMLALSHLILAERFAAGGSVHTAKEHLAQVDAYTKRTGGIDTASITARAVLCRAMVQDPLTPKYALEDDAYAAAATAATSAELYHYIKEDQAYPYVSPIYALHMQAKRCMKEYRYAEAIAHLESAIADKTAQETSVLVLYRIYADMEICYRERRDYENAYRYATKKNTLFASFQA